jgi:hypothetical protein
VSASARHETCTLEFAAATLASVTSGDAKSRSFFFARRTSPRRRTHGHPPPVRAHEGHETRHIPEREQEREVIHDTRAHDPSERAGRELTTAIESSHDAG